ncbi:MAG: hypothetical protein BJ554DRAFT_2711 [Olpidium bornovanus]|uniref:Sperm-associated antigen 6 n=1 Tax=Olpidium bornovanus TaxID=278681 RepID=A0A8H7ZQB4_9FUNG|nr:MAG: hypothetical protein BJ554DRAFT_2711 [Olpidium bornovanus]
MTPERESNAVRGAAPQVLQESRGVRPPGGGEALAGARAVRRRLGGAGSAGVLPRGVRPGREGGGGVGARVHRPAQRRPGAGGGGRRGDPAAGAVRAGARAEPAADRGVRALGHRKAQPGAGPGRGRREHHPVRRPAPGEPGREAQVPGVLGPQPDRKAHRGPGGDGRRRGDLPQRAQLPQGPRRHTAELAQLIVNSGGIAAIVDYVNESRGMARLPGIMALGYIAAFSETLALSVIVSKGVQPLSDALVSETEEHIKAACAWSLGQIGRHSPDHAKTLADHAVLSKLLKVLTSVGKGGEEVGADFKTKTKRALKCILEKTLHLDALEPLLQPSTPPNILKYVVAQFAKILPHDVAARRAFVTSGGLQRVQEIATGLAQAQGGGAQNLSSSKMAEYIRVIDECYPEEIVRYYSPGYSATLLDKIDEYSRMQEFVAGGQNTGGGPGISANAPAQFKSTTVGQEANMAQGVTV